MKAKSIFFVLTLSIISLVGCGHEQVDEMDKSEVQGKMMGKSPIYDSIVIVDPVEANINATIFTSGTCYSLASGYGENYYYYVSSSVTETYDRVVHSTIFKGTAMYFVQPLTIPAGQNVSENIILFNNEKTKVGNVQIKIMSVLNNNVDITNNYTKVNFTGFINNCFSKPLTLPEDPEKPCKDFLGFPIDENGDGIMDCIQ